MKAVQEIADSTIGMPLKWEFVKWWSRGGIDQEGKLQGL